VHGFKDVGQAEIHTADPLVPERSAPEVELAFDKLKSHKSPGIDQIPAELIKVGDRTICLEIHKLITSMWKEKLFVFRCHLNELFHKFICEINKTNDTTRKRTAYSLKTKHVALWVYNAKCIVGVSFKTW
jgi:hypothetical protein